MTLQVKHPPAMQETQKGSIPGSGRSHGEEDDNPLHYPCLGNPMDRGAWRATVQRVSKSQTELCDYADPDTGKISKIHKCFWEPLEQFYSEAQLCPLFQ